MDAKKTDDHDFSFFLRVLAQSSRDGSASSNSAQENAVLDAITKLHTMCEGHIDLVGTVNNSVNKLFQRSTASVTQYRSSTGLLMLAILQFFLDFGEYVLHDADPSLNIFFKSCLSRLYADPVVAGATVNFLNRNKKKLLLSHPTLLPQYFPLLLKVIAWNGKILDADFLQLFPALMGPTSFLPLFPALLDLPTLVLALEDLERRSGSLLSENVAAVQKSPAAEALLALMDEAYTGSSTPDPGGDSGDEESTSKDEANALFADLLKDENDGLAERHWKSPEMAQAIKAVMGSAQSEKLQHATKLVPTLLKLYFGVAIRDVNDSLLCALLPILFQRFDAMFPDEKFCLEVQKECLGFILTAFQRFPELICVLKKPIVDKICQPYESDAKAELALQLCWAIGEHGGCDPSYKGVARELFECLELLLFENISSRGIRTLDSSGTVTEADILVRATQSRLLCVVVTAITKLATCHRELRPRAHVCLTKVARSQQVLDRVVWRRACDYLGLMNEPAICSSILGSSAGYEDRPGNIRWINAPRKAIAHIPFHLLQGTQGPPFHDFSLSDLLGQS